jgi:hypothetical protein
MDHHDSPPLLLTISTSMVANIVPKSKTKYKQLIVDRVERWGKIRSFSSLIVSKIK